MTRRAVTCPILTCSVYTPEVAKFSIYSILGDLRCAQSRRDNLSLFVCSLNIVIDAMLAALCTSTIRKCIFVVKTCIEA